MKKVQLCLGRNYPLRILKNQPEYRIYKWNKAIKTIPDQYYQNQKTLRRLVDRKGAIRIQTHFCLSNFTTAISFCLDTHETSKLSGSLFTTLTLFFINKAVSQTP
jgi:hypothetical protein